MKYFQHHEHHFDINEDYFHFQFEPMQRFIYFISFGLGTFWKNLFKTNLITMDININEDYFHFEFEPMQSGLWLVII